VQLVTIEQGKRTGSIATLKRIAEALSVDLDMIA
jgi:transcriptional regulator with XRE-family HTH domain